MGSVKLMMSENLRIKWPDQCAACNNPSTDSATTSITNTTKFRYYVVAMSFTHQTYSFSYPVCKKHKRLCNLLDQSAKSSLLNNTLVFFFGVLILWLILNFLFSSTLKIIGLEIIDQNSIDYWSFMSSLVVATLLIIYSFFLKPVRISNLSEDSMEISIKNDKYLNYFKALNNEHTIK